MAHAGKLLGQRFLDALGAMADRLHLVAAARAAFGQRLIGAAVMAAQPLRAQMHGQARIAAAAGRDPAAARAEQRRRVAAAVEIQQHLACRLPGGAGCLQQRRRRCPCAPACARRSISVSRGGCALPGALRQQQMRVAALARTFCSDSSDGVAEPSTTGTFCALAAHHREIARRIAEAAFLLLVRAVVLLVDDDQPQRRQRREHRRARADHDARLHRVAADARPRALAFGESRMQRGDARREAALETLEQAAASARSPAQHQRLAAARQHVADERAGTPRSCRCRSRHPAGRRRSDARPQRSACTASFLAAVQRRRRFHGR